MLLALGSLWNPRRFSGLRDVSRYLLNVGTPFENWLTQLAEAARREHDAASYPRHAINLLADFRGYPACSAITGRNWQIGQFSEYAVVVQEGELRLTVYAATAPFRCAAAYPLLAQLIGYFYQ